MLSFPNTVIIGLGSPTGPESGKSTAARMILDSTYAHQKKKNGCVVSFATPMKQASNILMREIFGIEHPEMLKKTDVLMEMGSGDDDDLEMITVRDLYVCMGTSIGRDCISPDIWVDRAFKIIGELAKDAYQSNQPLLVVIDDVRFQNEADRIRLAGGKVYGVMDISDDSIANPRKDAKTDLTLNDYDDFLNNDKTFSLLESEVEKKVVPFIRRNFVFSK